MLFIALMYDKYDSPHGEEPQGYGPSAQDQLGEQAAPIADALRANWKMIAAAIVVLLAAYFAYDFFVGSYREVTVQVSNTEGMAVPATVKISTEGGQEVATITAGQKAKIKLGNYTLSAAASGYRAISDSPLTVSENSTETIELEADKDIRLGGTFPQTLITGEEKNIELTFTNASPSGEKVELVLEGDAAKDFRLNYKPPIDAPSGESTVSATIAVSDKASGSKAGAERSGSIRIKGLRANATLDAKYRLIQFDESKLDIRLDGDKSNADFGRLSPGERKAKRITFENRNEFDVEGLAITKNVPSSDFDSSYKIEDWLTQNPKGAVDVKADERSKDVQLELAIPRDVAFPADAKSVKSSGTITVKNTYYTKEFTFTFEVQKPEAKLDIEMDLSPRVTSKDNAWQAIPGTMRVINKGQVDLTDIRLQVKCNSQGTQWLTIFDSEANDYKSSITIDRLAGSSDPKVVAYRIEVPGTTKANETSVCSIKARYDDPNGTAEPVEKIVTIRAG